MYLGCDSRNTAGEGVYVLTAVGKVSPGFYRFSGRWRGIESESSAASFLAVGIVMIYYNGPHTCHNDIICICRVDSGWKIVFLQLTVLWEVQNDTKSNNILQSLLYFIIIKIIINSIWAIFIPIRFYRSIFIPIKLTQRYLSLNGSKFNGKVSFFNSGGEFSYNNNNQNIQSLNNSNFTNFTLNNI